MQYVTTISVIYKASLILKIYERKRHKLNFNFIAGSKPEIEPYKDINKTPPTIRFTQT